MNMLKDRPSTRHQSELRQRLAGLAGTLRPGPAAWQGAALAVRIGFALLALIGAYFLFARAGWLPALLGGAAFLGLMALTASLLDLIAGILNRIPKVYGLALAFCLPAALLLVPPGSPVIVSGVLVLLVALALLSLLGAGLAGLRPARWKALSRLRRCVSAVGLVAGAAGLVAWSAFIVSDGYPAPALPEGWNWGSDLVAPLSLPDPSQPGSYTVKSLTYGSGTDRRRPEFGPEVNLQTIPVDGTKLVGGWSPLRSSYWGFGPQSLPLNGRVWYPEGAGPFPLVLMVHGNHAMEQYSDPGYAYLGELFASRGFVAVSVDENFLNGSSAADLLMISPLTQEMDARAWLLLEHLNAWRGWNATPGNPFTGLVDLNRVALIGHSRGGEAVALAALFNGLPCSPDDAALAFSYGFGIRAVAAIAPSEGRYLPGGRQVEIEDVSYLVVQGAHDMDVTTFMGYRQYENARYSGLVDAFKASLYIYGANHGQFSTVWGRKDNSEPLMRLYNLKQLMPAQEQTRIAQVYLSAFLEDTLHGHQGYRPLFQDARTAPSWLPETLYLNAYQDASTRLIATYEEDLHLQTLTLPGGSLQGEGLTLWKEVFVKGKSGSLGTHAVVLGWDHGAGPAAYTAQLPDAGLACTAESALVFSLADAGVDPNPGRPAGSPRARLDSGEPIDFTLELIDAAGNSARLPLSRYAPLLRQVRADIAKLKALGTTNPSAEPVFRDYAFPLSAFAEANPQFSPARLVALRFVFDRTPDGSLLLDNVGLRQP
ncbi:MAG TPA: MFS transporter [Anaerolineae bacterium]|nr:MFS transporter [Anaerolineae bacterium]HOR01012.1 MFS transporter [Anaerolineae bacterium]HPL29477.1 hypothetical protein [Anaerolineae bacterium]